MDEETNNFKSLYNLNKPQVIWKNIEADLETPVSALIKLSKNKKYSFLLESVEGGITRGRYSAIGVNPDLIWQCKNGKSELYHSEINSNNLISKSNDPLSSLKNLINSTKINLPKDLPPLSAGLFGYLGYDMVKYFEDIHLNDNDPLELPETILIRPSLICIFDRLKDEFMLVTPIWPKKGVSSSQAWSKAQDRLNIAIKELNEGLTHSNLPLKPNTFTEFQADTNFKKEEYYNIVDKAKNFILEGDIYQVVLSQRFKTPFNKSSISFYRALRRLNPSPFLFHFDFDSFSVVGSSPEILVRVRDKNCTIRPIAGTRPRGKTPEEDKNNEEELINDEKERAEHLMLLDLGRNDVGRVSEPGTVEVTESFSVEKYSHVMHIESEVNGKLREGMTAIDALIAGFPAGTVSGAPKIRAMEIINELENDRRGIYSGAVGYISASGDLDTCIALRTGIIKDNFLYVQAGAGIVHDSVKEHEEVETRNKAKALMKAAEIAN